ncbi:MAG: hypothetical protein AAB250_16115, partial [Bdellovibrionota bacterium]
MDRFLIAGAALLLVFEITFLVMDLDESSSRSNQSASSTKSIGTLVEKKNGVHRRGSNTLIWDDSHISDTLYEYDSVLTLTGSSARLKLKGETNLDLDQDSLVVLEPSGETSDGRLKIRFARGSMRTKNTAEGLSVANGVVQISTDPGTALRLSGLADGRLHVEVELGSAKLQSPNGAESISGGEHLLLREGVIEERSVPNAALKFAPNTAARVYVSSFPAEFAVSWEGNASRLKILDSNRTLASVVTRGNEAKLKLAEGTSRLWLEHDGKVSEPIEVDVRGNPTLRQFSPLARDRFTVGQDVVFAWEPAAFVAKYRLELSKRESFDELFRAMDVTEPRANLQFSEVGSYFWRVKAVDETGLVSPASKISNFSLVPVRLEAPTLNAPEIREPAEEEVKKPSRDGASLLFDLFVAQARAESRQVEAVLSWQPMAGAEYYVIEISTTPGFETPLVNKKLSEPKFVHRGGRGSQVFWRVAAGRGDVLGPFSAAALVKLEGARGDTPKVAVTAPLPKPVGIIVVATPSPTPQPVAVETPPEKVTEVQVPALVVAAPTPIPQTTPAISFAEKSNRKSGRFLFLPKFRQTESTNELAVQGSVTGAIPLAFAAEGYLAQGEAGRH